jgi:hypothetical protein
MLEIQVLTWDRHNNVVRLNLLMVGWLVLQRWLTITPISTKPKITFYLNLLNIQKDQDK